ncbi:MAG TPA: PQQ-binding-like beta-propeller repeat protein [Gemmataceae bacterium]|nr:PQQ-binding-like beta-propeller repeat protein [Gemmataceae bacterium]
MTSTHWCRLPALVLVLFVLSLPAADDKPSADWPMVRGNPLQNGVAGTDLPQELQLRWKFETKDAIEGTAAIVGDTVYVGSFDQHLYALDLASGKEKWKYKGGPFRASPSVRGGLVYVGDGDGTFHCVEAATGKKRWTFATKAEIMSGANFAGDAVLFGSSDEHLYCLSGDGKLRWKFQVPGGPVLGSPAVVDGRTFVAGCDSALHVLDAAKGTELKSVELSGQVGASVAVAGDRLYVGTMTNQVQAIDWKAGKVLWTFEAKKQRQPFYASAAVTEQLVIIGSRDRRVYALDRTKGTEVWSFLTGNRVDSSPVVAGQRVFVGSFDGKLYVLDLEKGTELQRFDLGSAIIASPAVGRGCLVIGTEKGVVYCFGTKQ